MKSSRRPGLDEKGESTETTNRCLPPAHNHAAESLPDRPNVFGKNTGTCPDHFAGRQRHEPAAKEFSALKK